MSVRTARTWQRGRLPGHVPSSGVSRDFSRVNKSTGRVDYRRCGPLEGSRQAPPDLDRPGPDDSDQRGVARVQYEDEEAPERVEMHLARAVCESCKLRSRCPVRWRRRPELGGEWSPSGAYVLSADLARVNIGRRRRAESDGQWRRRYGLRAGIEGTNSELKRRHGLGRLRVRGGERVRLAVYLKALACNVKRMVRPAALATAPPTA